MSDPVAVHGPDDAAVLGPEVLAQLVERAADGISLCDADRRLFYVNPAGCAMLGRSPGQLLGHDFVDMVASASRPFAEEFYPQLLAGSTDVFYAPFATAAGDERELIHTTHPVVLDDRLYVAAVFRDLSGPRAAAEAAAALGQSAADLVTTKSTQDILDGIAAHVLDGVDAVSAALFVIDESGRLTLGGECSPGGPGLRSAFAPGGWFAGRPAEELLIALTGGAVDLADVIRQPVVIDDLRSAWRRDPLVSELLADGVDHVRDHPGWRSALCVPLTWDDELTGALVVFLAVGSGRLAEPAIAFCSALADHAAAAVANSRLTRQAGQAAALRERSSLVRELHDSVSQVLFAMAMRAGAVELALDSAQFRDDGALRRSVDQLVQLTRGALAEMRALIFQLRPDALVEDGLVGALVVHAAALSAREQVAITVDAPSEPLELDGGQGGEVEEHLYRIVCEALHNVVKHACADRAVVTIRVVDRELHITVVDDGIGFDPMTSRAGHLGLTTMAQRAQAIGAELTVTSGPGTTVSLRAAIDGRQHTRNRPS